MSGKHEGFTTTTEGGKDGAFAGSAGFEAKLGKLLDQIFCGKFGEAGRAGGLAQGKDLGYSIFCVFI